MGARASSVRGLSRTDLSIFGEGAFQARRAAREAGEDRITVKIRLQSQPWHMYLGVIVRCILAASTLEAGKEAAKTVMLAVANHREEFEFERHCRGPNIDGTPNEIIARIEGYSGVKLVEAFAIPISTAKSNGTASMPARTASMCRRLHDRWAGPSRHEQWRRGRGLGVASAEGLNDAISFVLKLLARLVGRELLTRRDVWRWLEESQGKTAAGRGNGRFLQQSGRIQ